MKRLYIFTLIILTSYSYSQNANVRLLYKSSDIDKPANDKLDIRRVRYAIFSDSILVRLKDKTKLMLPDNKIWGFQDRDNVVHRCYDGDSYTVRQLDTLMIYSRYSGKHTDYFFSCGRDGKILGLSTGNLKKVFPDNACFLNKLDNDLKWYQDYTSFDDKQRSYRIVEFFKACL